MLMISLEWRRPVDGTSVVDAREVLADAPPGSAAIVGRTSKTVSYRRTVENLEDTVALHLINANTLEKLCQFVSRFGVLGRFGYNHSREAELVAFLEAERETIEDGLALLNTGDAAAREKWAEKYLREAELHPTFERPTSGGTSRVTLRAGSLRSLMLCEVALAMEQGTKRVQCGSCGKVFLTGELTGRRNTSIYCSDRCRVAGMRARNKAKGEI